MSLFRNCNSNKNWNLTEVLTDENKESHAGGNRY